MTEDKSRRAMDARIFDDRRDRGGAMPDPLDRTLSSAHAASRHVAALTHDARASILDALAEALDGNADELAEVAAAETHLPRSRLIGEIGRASFQLRSFASIVRDGSFLDVRIDHPDPDWPVAPRPDLRRTRRPIGPVLVFAAGNFPFAFSVLGGDTASALAAGNSVVVKAHPGHPRLSRRTAELGAEALRRTGAPDGALQLIEGTAAGIAALQDPRISAAGFTGSIAAGRMLADIAAARPTPIPFYGELGSNNPVFVTESAAQAEAASIADGFVRSFTLAAGQLCTKPGTLIVPAGSAAVTALQAHDLPAPAPLLNAHITGGYHARLRALASAPGVTALRCDGDPYAPDPAPILLRASARQVLEDPERYLEECFGPASLVVEYASSDELVPLASAFAGQLTATVFGTGDDAPGDLIDALADRAGRVLWRQWPTGVAVTSAQQHGGPYPASTAPHSTSVGFAAIERFTRPVAYQGFPPHLLPPELRAT